MKKVRENWSLASFGRGWKTQKKTCRWWRLLLICAWAVVAGAVFSTTSHAVMSCEEALAAGGCIVINVTSFLSQDFSSTEPPVGYILSTRSPDSGMDHTCSPQISSDPQQVTVVRGQRYYNVASFKYFYSPETKMWHQFGSVGGLFWANESDNSAWISAADYVMTSYTSNPPYYTTPAVMYPEGCPGSDTAPTPDTPNNDSGDPECSNIFLP